MSARARTGLAVAVVAGVELYLLVRYAANGATFHYWLHLLLGGYLGIGLLVLRRLRRTRPARLRSWQAGFLGHLYSATPDVMFLAVGLLHERWMDVFALHITAHFLWPNALLAGLVLWTLVVVAYVAAVFGARRCSALGLLSSLAFLAVAVTLRAPLPTTLEQAREQAAGRQALRALLSSPQWLCGAVPVVRDLPPGADRVHGHTAR